MLRSLKPVLSLAKCVIVLYASAASAGVLDTNLTIPWVPHSTVGVRGGVVTRTNLVPVTNFTQAAIQAAINAATSNDVVYLSNGTYIIDGTLTVNKSHISLRGESKAGVVLVKTNAVNGMMTIGGSDTGQDNYLTINSGFEKGATNITLAGNASTIGTAAGDVVTVSMLNPLHESWRVVSVSAFPRVVRQHALVVSISNGTNLTIWPPLICGFTNSPRLTAVGATATHPVYGSKHRIGLERMTLTQTNAGTGMVGSGINMIQWQNAADCWMTEVAVEWPKNYGVAINNVAMFYAASNSVVRNQNTNAVSNQAAFFIGSGTGILLENNIMAHGMYPGIEFYGGFSGNAIFGNYFTNNWLDIDCHNAHSMMNLWEANVSDTSFMLDGYFGSASHQVLWRNQFSSGFIPVALKRWSTYVQVVGNVLGQSGGAYLAFSHDTNAVGWQILELGRPAIGSTSYVGTNPPVAWNFPGGYNYGYGGYSNLNGFTFTNNQTSTTNLVGDFSWVPAPYATVHTLVIRSAANTNYYFNGDEGLVLVNVTAGTSSNLHVGNPATVQAGDTLFIGGPTAFFQLQTDERSTHRVWDNYDYFNNGIQAGTDTNETVEASILYPSAAPSWWGTNRWPAIDPEASPYVAPIPAQLRDAGVDGGGDTPASPRRLRVKLRRQ
jgi:hypothetical protein